MRVKHEPPPPSVGGVAAVRASIACMALVRWRARKGRVWNWMRRAAAWRAFSYSRSRLFRPKRSARDCLAKE